MNKKQLVNQLNSQKGLTGADVVLALLIILTTVGVIAMVYANLVVGSRGVDRKAGATRIATNILENMSQIYYDEINEHLEVLFTQGTATKQDSTYSISGGNQVKVFNTKIPKGYNLEINLQNSYGEENAGYDLVKKVGITVNYTVNAQNEKVTLNKVLTRETVRECNTPNFSETYIRQMTSENYEMYSENSQNAAGIKVICPIRYNKQAKRYEIINNTDSLWYSYSNKQWARVLVLDPSGVEGEITQEMLKGSNSYVWIPRFGVENGKDLLDGTYFKYKATDYAILNSYDKKPKPSFFYNYIDSDFNWSSNRGISEEGLLGRWCAYSELTNSTNQSAAYILNSSGYGPMAEY